MSERFLQYMERIERLSDERLDRSVGRLVASENRRIACFIAHLSEIGERGLPLDLGYRSLFEYAVRRLGLSEGSVYLRLQVAGVCRKLPQVLEAIADGRVSLTVAGKLAPRLDEENVARLLSECAGMTKREVEEYLVGFEPKPVVEPGIRKRPALAPASARGNEAPRSSRSPPAAPAQTRSVSRGVVEPARPEVFNFRFAADRGFKEKLGRLAEVIGIDGVERRMAEVLEYALDCALDRRDPARRLERRRERERRAAERSADERERAVASCPRPDERDTSVSRHVPVAMRDRVLERAGYRCEFEGPDGRRCTARAGLTIEHDEPWAVSRTHDEGRLRAFCASHNLLNARRYYGEEFIAAKIARRTAVTRGCG